jgi:hypothetical protein
MATCRAIIKRALQKLAIIAPGNDPEASEADTGLAVVQGLFDGWGSGGMFGRVINGLAGIDPDTIVSTALPEPGAPVELPILVRDSDGEEVPPPDLAYAEHVDETTSDRRAYLYDGRMAKWVRVDALTLDSDCPLARRNSEGMAAVVAVAMAEDFGVTPGPRLTVQAGQFLFGMSARYGEKRRVGTAVYF